MRKSKWLILFVFIIALPSIVFANTGTVSNTQKYAWSNNAGWINFNPASGNVSISDTALTGYIWNEIYGWINLAPAGSGVVNTTSGILSGYAWGENAGWINFSGARIACSGKFVGTATGDTVGTITFECANCNVTTNWLPTIGCSGGGGGGDNPPLTPVFHNVCNAQKQCVSVLGSSSNQCQQDSDCVVEPPPPPPPVFHNICNAQKQCVSVLGSSSNQCQQDSDCVVEPPPPPPVFHNECNAQKQCVSVQWEGVNACQANNDCAGEIIPPPPPPPPEPPPVGGGGEIVEEKKPEIIETIIAPVEVVKEVVQNVLPESVKETAVRVKEIIETPQGSAATKTVSTAGAVVATAQVAASVFIFSPLELFSVLLRVLAMTLTAFGLKKQIKRWGVVYDSVTKQPLDPAYVTLIDSAGKTVATAITDLDGRFGFLASPGIYRLSANKTNYAFPSQKLAGKFEDELYFDLYFGEEIEIKEDGQAIIKNLPMDPLKFDWNEFAKKDRGLMKFYSKFDIFLRFFFEAVFVAGFIVAIIAFFAAPYPYNLVIFCIYIVLLILRMVGLKPKAYGRITTVGGDPLSFAILRVFSPETNIEVAHKVADKYGRFYCLVPKGKYYIKIEEKRADGSYWQVFAGPMDFSHKGIIKNHFKIQKDAQAL